MPKGKKQHFDLGQLMREKYITEKQFIRPNYSESEVFVQTTFKQRTYLSSVY